MFPWWDYKLGYFLDVRNRFSVVKNKYPDRTLFEWIVNHNPWRGFLTLRLKVECEAEIGEWLKILYEIFRYRFHCGFVVYLEVGSDAIPHFHALTLCALTKTEQRAIRKSCKNASKRVNGSVVSPSAVHYRDVYDLGGIAEYAQKPQKYDRDSLLLPRGWKWEKVKGRFYRTGGEVLKPHISTKELQRLNRIKINFSNTSENATKVSHKIDSEDSNEKDNWNLMDFLLP